MKIFKFLTISLFAFVFLSFSNISYADIWGDYEYTLNGDGVSVTLNSYSGPGGDLVIPETIDIGGTDYGVTAIIGNIVGSMTSSDTITSLTIPSSVLVIGNNSFGNATNLTSVVFNEGLETITDGSFSGASLTSIIIPNSVRTITNGAFSGVSTLNSVDLGEGIETISNGAFSGTSIASIIIPDSVTLLSVGSLPITLQGIEIGSGIETLSDGIFSGFSNLTNVVLSEGLDLISNNAFSGTSITSIIIPNSVKTITSGAFSGTPTLTSVDLGEGVETISNSAFGGTSLTSIVIPDSVRTITNGAFSGVSTLNSVDLGEGIETISNSAFSGTSIASIIIPDSVTLLGVGSLPTTLQSMEIGSGIKTLRSGIFNNFSNLTNVVLSEGLEVIIEGAFGNTGITSIVIPDSVIQLGSGIFMGSPLASVEVGGGVKIIDSGVFSDFPTLTSVTLNEGLETINNCAFCRTGITNIIIPNSVKTIGHVAFSETGITSMIIPDSVTTLVGGTIFYNTPLESIEIGGGITSLMSTFANVSTLTNVVLSEGLEIISSGAFGDTNITSIVIPTTVNTLVYGAFYNNENLNEAYFLGDAPLTIDNSIFSGSAPSFTLYYYEGKTGFDGDWNIYNTIMLPKPTVSTTSASGITGNSVSVGIDLVSFDNYMNRTNLWGVEYGLTNAYGELLENESESFESGQFFQNLSNLTCNTTYHYRSYATNNAGTSYGDDMTFTTSACTEEVKKKSSKVIGSIGSIHTGGLINQPVVTTTTITPPQVPTITISTPVISYTRLIRQGMRGDDIKQIQLYLNSKGYDLGLADGIFGPKTRNAVILFQKANELTPDGLIGKFTITKINELR